MIPKQGYVSSAQTVLATSRLLGGMAAELATETYPCFGITIYVLLRFTYRLAYLIILFARAFAILCR